MRKITSITEEARQRFSVPILGQDRGDFTLSLSYRPYTRCWTADIAYKDFKVRGLRLVLDENLLRPWRYLFPFGLRCLSTDGGDPLLITDFSEDVCSLYVLDTRHEIFEEL